MFTKINNKPVSSSTSTTDKEFKSKKYELDKPKSSDDEQNMLDYIKEYDKYKDVDNELPDTDLIGN